MSRQMSVKERLSLEFVTEKGKAAYSGASCPSKKTNKAVSQYSKALLEFPALDLFDETVATETYPLSALTVATQTVIQSVADTVAATPALVESLNQSLAATSEIAPAATYASEAVSELMSLFGAVQSNE